MREIKIVGAGCKRCAELATKVDHLLDKHGCEATVIKISDFQQMAELGVFSTPGLIVDGAIKAVGRVPRDEEIVKWLAD